jgi:hypothetical protein
MSSYGQKPSQQPYSYEPVSTPLTPQEDGYRSVMRSKRRTAHHPASVPAPSYQATAAVATNTFVETDWAWEEPGVTDPDPFEYDEFEEELLPFTAEFDFPSTNRRMALVMVGVMLMVLLGTGLLWWSGFGDQLTAVSGVASSASGTAATSSEPQQAGDPAYTAVLSDEATANIIASGQLSPIFAPEVLFWAPKIVEWANQWNLDPNLVATVMQIESCGDPQAISSAGARGLFQVMPFHFDAGEDMFDPDTNAYRGMKYLALGLEMHANDPNLAMAGYNGGHGTVPKGWANWPNEMQRYYRWGSGIYGEVTAGQANSPTLDQWLAAGGAGLCRQAADRQVTLGLR